MGNTMSFTYQSAHKALDQKARQHQHPADASPNVSETRLIINIAPVLSFSSANSPTPKSRLTSPPSIPTEIVSEHHYQTTWAAHHPNRPELAPGSPRPPIRATPALENFAPASCPSAGLTINQLKRIMPTMSRSKGPNAR